MPTTINKYFFFSAAEPPKAEPAERSQRSEATRKSEGSGAAEDETSTTTLEESKHALNGTTVPLGMSVSESRGRAYLIFRP